MSIKPDFQKSSQRITTVFSVASNLAVAALITYIALNQDETFETTTTSTDNDISLDHTIIAPEAPIAITLTNGLALRFDDRNDLFNMREKMINQAYYDSEYNRFHEKPPELHAAFLALEQITPLPYEAYQAAAWKETRLQPDTVNKSSGAKGYFQFKPEAFYEALYFMRDRYPQLSVVTSLIERENATADNNYTLSYRPLNEQAKGQLEQAVHDPLVSGLAYYSYLDHYMQNYVLKKIPELQPNQTDYYLISFRGPGGASEFLQALKETPNAMAHDMFITDSHPEGFTHPFVAQNKSIYYDAGREEYRTYQEVYDYIADDMGIGRDLVQQDQPTRIIATLVPLNDQLQPNVVPANSLIFAENIIRPNERPENLEGEMLVVDASLPPAAKPE